MQKKNEAARCKRLNNSVNCFWQTLGHKLQAARGKRMNKSLATNYMVWTNSLDKMRGSVFMPIEENNVFNRPGVAGAVLQTHS